MIMDVCRYIHFNTSRAACWCRYYGRWNKIPVFVTEDDPDSRSALYKDGTCFIILGVSLLKPGAEALVANRLWHEAAHLYFKDAWQPWRLEQEYRADLIAAAATGRDTTLRRLNDMRRRAAGTGAEQVLLKRIANLMNTPNSYTKVFCLELLDSLRPVKVMK